MPNTWTRFRKEISLKNNVYVVLFVGLLLVMTLYSVSRLAFYVFHQSYFSDMTFSRLWRIMYGGIRFDLTAILYSNLLFFLLLVFPWKIKFRAWYQLTVRALFIVINALMLAINTADFVYYKFALRRSTRHVFDEFQHEKGKIALFFGFLWDYIYLALFWLILLFILVSVYRKMTFKGPQIKNPWLFYVGGLGVMLFLTFLFVGGVRGGFDHSTRPITIVDAAAYAKKTRDIDLVLNTPFAFLRTAGTKVIEKKIYFDNPATGKTYFDPIKKPDLSSPFKKENVIVFILESFSKEFVGAYNKKIDSGTYTGYAPFLDSLISVGLSYKYSFANGRKSIEAMPSVLASIPSLEVPYSLSHFSVNVVKATPSLLRDRGYFTSFFHGAPNGSMGFNAMANQYGFHQYYGKDEYNNDDDYDGIWGIWDEKFFQFMANQIDSFDPPFYVSVFTVSSHHPYNLPKEHANRFKGGPLPVHRTIEYTDYALRKFFQRAKMSPWFKNTLFVFTSDHASAEVEYDQYHTAHGYFAIPIFFYKPGENLGGLRPEIIQQIDIMPTILGYLNYDKPYVAFGRDVLHDEGKPVVINYLNHQYQLSRGDYMLWFDGKKSVALYNFKTDPFFHHNLKDQLPDTVMEMELYSKAFLQEYSMRIVDNQMTFQENYSKYEDKKHDEDD